MLVRSWRQLQNTRRAHQLAVARVLQSQHKIKTVVAAEPGIRRVRFSPMALQMLVHSCFPSPKKTVFHSPWSALFWSLLRRHEFLVRGDILRLFVREYTGSGFVEAECEYLIDYDDIQHTRHCILHLHAEAFHTYMMQLASIWLGKLGQPVAAFIVILLGTRINIMSLSAWYVTHDEHPPPPEPLVLIPTIQPNAPSA